MRKIWLRKGQDHTASNIYIVDRETNKYVNIICKIINLPIEKPKILLYNYFERRKADGTG